jgi:hypothetical protein
MSTANDKVLQKLNAMVSGIELTPTRKKTKKGAGSFKRKTIDLEPKRHDPLEGQGVLFVEAD